MKNRTVFKRDNKNFKKLRHLKNLVSLLHAPRNINICPMQYEMEDTEVIVSLLENFQGYVTSKFRTDEIEEIFCGEQRILIGILNKSLTENIEIKTKSMLGFFVLETKSDIKIKQETQTKKKQTSSKISKKNTNGWLSKQV